MKPQIILSILLILIFIFPTVYNFKNGLVELGIVGIAVILPCLIYLVVQLLA